MIDKWARIRAIVVLIFGFIVLALTSAKAQKVMQCGNTFTPVNVDSSKSQETKTKYTIIASDKKEYVIYLSKNGKAYIYRVSKKSGKTYKQYLPEITKRLQNGKRAN
ncbi:MAG: hypothetical protein K2O48_00050 [Prevotella sp.]|nr:hypothetical protein [Prevotella sp.]